jgi:hypothetical protein
VANSGKLPPDSDSYQYFYHAFRNRSTADKVAEEGLKAGTSNGNVFLSKDEIRDLGAGYAVVRVPTGQAKESVDVVEQGLKYRQWTLSQVPASDIVSIVREIPYGTGGHGIRENDLARWAIDHQGEDASDLPVQYRGWFSIHNKKSLKASPSIVIPDWIEDPDVLDALEREMFRFAQGIDQTTADALREELMDGMENGETISQLADRISDLSDEWVEGWRSEMIARTETARAFTTGHIEAWKSTGVVSRKVWVAADDACFTADSLVLKYEGCRVVPVAIGTIQKGDLVVGGSGKPCLVTGTSSKDYSGDVVRGENFTATPDHMFLTAGGTWEPIGKYAAEAVWKVVVNFLVRKAQDIPAALHKVFVLPPVLGGYFGLGVPVYAVALDDEFPVADKEVDDPLPTHGYLLFKRDVVGTKEFGHSQLDTGSFVKGLDVDDVAVDGAVTCLSARALTYMRTLSQKFFATCRAGALGLRSSRRVFWSFQKDRVGLVSTFARAKFMVSSLFIDCSTDTTAPIDIRRIFGVTHHGDIATFAAAKLGLLRLLVGKGSKQFAAYLAGFICPVGKSLRLMAASLAAYLPVMFRVQVGGYLGRVKGGAAHLASALFDFHGRIIPCLRRQVKPYFGKVYDIQVEGEHCFTLACGLVAHNCPFCREMDGTVVGLDENFLDKGDEQDVPWRGETIVLGQDYSAVNGPPLHPNCIVYEDTPITTFAGLKKIKDVKEGDLVLTHRGRFRKVTKTFRHTYTGNVVKIRFGGVAWVTVTEDHPVLVNLEWVAAKDVKVGDKVSVAGSQGFVNTPVLNVDCGRVKDRAVYNLSVAEDESYIAKGMVVHNCRCVLIAELDEEKMVSQKGGPGSGNFGHEGRPGEVGGSGPGEDENLEQEGYKKIPFKQIPLKLYVGLHGDWFTGFEGQRGEPIKDTGLVRGKKTQFVAESNRRDMIFLATTPDRARAYANLYARPMVLEIDTSKLSNQFFTDPQDVPDRGQVGQVAYQGDIPSDSIRVFEDRKIKEKVNIPQENRKA